MSPESATPQHLASSVKTSWSVLHFRPRLPELHLFVEPFLCPFPPPFGLFAGPTRNGHPWSFPEAELYLFVDLPLLTCSLRAMLVSHQFRG